MGRRYDGRSDELYPDVDIILWNGAGITGVLDQSTFRTSASMKIKHLDGVDWNFGLECTNMTLQSAIRRVIIPQMYITLPSFNWV